MKRDVFEGASWIRAGREALSYSEFRTEFILNDPDPDAILYLSADSEFEILLNGQSAGSGQYDDFPMRKVYDARPVGFLTRKGSNELLIRLWHQDRGSFQYIPGPEGLIFCLECGGERILSRPGIPARPMTIYDQGPVEEITSQLGPCFHVDLTAKPAPWGAAEPVPERRGTGLRPRPIAFCREGEPVREREILRFPVKIGETGTAAERMQYASECAPDASADRMLVFDLGREEAGYLLLEAEAEAPEDLLIGWGEHIADGRPRTRVGGRNFAFPIRIPRGESRFVHRFRRLGARYLSVVAPEGTKILRLTLIPAEYPLSENVFESGDGMADRIFALSARTLKLCMHEHYEDSPWREQGLYAMDSRNQALCGYAAFSEKVFSRACLELMAEGLREDGILEITTPARYRITIPSFSLAWILMLRDHVLWTGDLGAAEKLLPSGERILSFFRKRKENGLICVPAEKEFWNFYEWAPGLDGSEPVPAEGRHDAALDLYYAIALGCMAQLYHWLGREDTAKGFTEERDEVNGAVRGRYLDREKGLFRRDDRGGTAEHELVQALAVLSGAAEGKTAAGILHALAGGKLPVQTTLSCAMFKYEALLTSEDHRCEAVDHCRSEWSKMVREGATSFWETKEGASAFEDAGSLCHGWSAVPAWLFVEGLLGIRPLEPGFSRFTWDPLPGYEKTRYVIRTDRGEIRFGGPEPLCGGKDQVRVNSVRGS